MEKPILLSRGEINFSNLESEPFKKKVKQVARILFSEALIDHGQQFAEQDIVCFDEIIDRLKLFTNLDEYSRFVKSINKPDFNSSQKLRKRLFSGGFAGVIDDEMEGSIPVIVILSKKDMESKFLHELQHVVDFLADIDCFSYDTDQVNSIAFKKLMSWGITFSSFAAELGVMYSMTSGVTSQNQGLYSLFMTTMFASASLAIHYDQQFRSLYTNSPAEIRAKETAKRIK